MYRNSQLIGAADYDSYEVKSEVRETREGLSEKAIESWVEGFDDWLESNTDIDRRNFEKKKSSKNLLGFMSYMLNFENLSREHNDFLPLIEEYVLCILDQAHVGIINGRATIVDEFSDKYPKHSRVINLNLDILLNWEYFLNKESEKYDEYMEKLSQLYEFMSTDYYLREYEYMIVFLTYLGLAFSQIIGGNKSDEMIPA